MEIYRSDKPESSRIEEVSMLTEKAHSIIRDIEHHTDRLNDLLLEAEEISGLAYPTCHTGPTGACLRHRMNQNRRNVGQDPEELHGKSLQDAHADLTITKIDGRHQIFSKIYFRLDESEGCDGMYWANLDAVDIRFSTLD